MKPAFRLCLEAAGEQPSTHEIISQVCLLGISGIGDTHWLTLSSKQVTPVQCLIGFPHQSQPIRFVSGSAHESQKSYNTLGRRLSLCKLYLSRSFWHAAPAVPDARGCHIWIQGDDLLCRRTFSPPLQCALQIGMSALSVAQRI